MTVEPCPMCASAMVHGRISRLVFGVREPKFGAVRSKFPFLSSNELNHRVQVEEGVLEVECAEILKGFFRRKRTKR